MSGRSVMRIEELSTLFPVRAGMFERTPPKFVHAVDGVSLDLRRGEILALVGESGCGKTTLALSLLGLEPATGGRILFEDQDVTHLRGKELKALRRRIQMVFQDPYESLSPRMRVGDIVAEPLVVHHVGADRRDREQRVQAALEDAGLRPGAEYAMRLPHELSGGQRQRVVIASALVLEPPVLLADEPVSMLDVSIRAEILNLLADLRDRKGITVLLITHDLSTAASYADRIAVMYLGKIVELGATADVLRAARHPYTQALLSVIPVPNPRLRREATILEGEIPNPIDIPPGCRFHPRCPIVQAHCRELAPEWRELAPGHFAACHEALVYPPVEATL
jgi:oligopeptide/dipeptide ABC transporter ATP-binding protein